MFVVRLDAAGEDAAVPGRWFMEAYFQLLRLIAM